MSCVGVQTQVRGAGETFTASSSRLEPEQRDAEVEPRFTVIAPASGGAAQQACRFLAISRFERERAEVVPRLGDRAVALDRRAVGRRGAAGVALSLQREAAQVVRLPALGIGRDGGVEGRERAVEVAALELGDAFGERGGGEGGEQGERGVHWARASGDRSVTSLSTSVVRMCARRVSSTILAPVVESRT